MPQNFISLLGLAPPPGSPPCSPGLPASSPPRPPTPHPLPQPYTCWWRARSPRVSSGDAKSWGRGSLPCVHWEDMNTADSTAAPPPTPSSSPPKYLSVAYLPSPSLCSSTSLWLTLGLMGLPPCTAVFLPSSALSKPRAFSPQLPQDTHLWPAAGVPQQ